MSRGLSKNAFPVQSQTEALRRERPQAHDLGYSFFLILNSENLRSVLELRISECHARAESCAHPTARAEWLDHVEKLRAVLAEEQ
jgi:hypothetical protein